VTIRPRLFAAAALLLAPVAILAIHTTTARSADAPQPAAQQDFVLGTQSQDMSMEQFLTGVTKDVDSYWTGVFKDEGRPEPRVSYAWIPSGQAASSACGTQGETAAAYCPGDDTIYISEDFADGIYSGGLNQSLPGSSEGYGSANGDFAVAFIVAHEYGHQIQDELGLYSKYGNTLPTMAFELQADCYAGTWAKHAADEGQLESGDVQEALDTALAVGDFSSDQRHHGTPEQRADAWNTGFKGGSPSSCDGYMDASNYGV
jgi:predicted metalloprotease